jgi:hypothetical protein
MIYTGGLMQANPLDDAFGSDVDRTTGASAYTHTPDAADFSGFTLDNATQTFSAAAQAVTSFAQWRIGVTDLVVGADVVLADLYSLFVEAPTASGDGDVTNIWAAGFGGAVYFGGAVSGGTVTKSFLIPSSMFAGAVTNPADGPVQVEYGTNDVDMWFMDFHDDVVSATDPIAKCRPIPLPDGISGTTVSVRAIWTDKNGDGAAATETIELECSMLVLGNDSAIDAAYGTAVPITDALIANDDLQTSAAAIVTPAGTLAGGSLLLVTLARDVSADTLVGFCRFAGLIVEYTSTLGD